MIIISEKKEIHLKNLTLDELVSEIDRIRSNPKFDNFKIMIDGFNTEPNSEGEF